MNQLRNVLAEHIEANSKTFSKVVEAENWIEARYPKEANRLIFASGLYIEKVLRRA